MRLNLGFSHVQLLLVWFDQGTGRLLSQPESCQHPALEGAPHPPQQLHLLLPFGPFPFFPLCLLHRIKADEARRLVQVNPDPGVLGDVPDVFAGAVGPHLVVRPSPPDTPGLVILPQAAGAVTGPPPCSLVGDSDHHPAGISHLPVCPGAQDAFLTNHL